MFAAMDRMPPVGCFFQLAGIDPGNGSGHHAKIRLYPNFPKGHFPLYTLAPRIAVILDGSKTCRNLRRDIQVAYNEKNDVRKGIQGSKSACSVLGYLDYPV